MAAARTPPRSASSVALVGAARSAFTALGGELAGWHPVDLAAAVMDAAAARAGIDAAAVDEVWVGCAEPVGAQGADMARAVVLAAGWPDHIGGTVVDRAETSGSAALHAAAAAIAAGSVGTVAVVGVSSASTVTPGASALGRTYGAPWGDGPARRLADRGGLLPPARAAERAAERLGIDRAAQDAAALRSVLRRANAAPHAVVAQPARPGDAVAVQRDAPVRADTRRPEFHDPAALPPMFAADGTVTALSFSPPVDGAAAVILDAGNEGLATLVTATRGAGDPLDPAGGIDHAVARADLDPAAIDRWEIAETTAAGFLVVCDRLGLDAADVNPAGGTLGAGDAGAAEEVRLTVDGVDAASDGALVATVAAGPTGSALTVWRVGSGPQPPTGS